MLTHLCFLSSSSITGAPLVAVIVVSFAWKLAVGTPEGYGAISLNLVGVSALAATAAVWAAPDIRAVARHYLLRVYGGAA